MATEYFQSELFASEMDAAWLHNIRYDKDQDLSEAQKARARNNMGAASFGSILKILGHYNTFEALQTSGEQKVGNAYSVGTVVPYKLYIFDGLSDSWLDYGFIRSQDISSRSIQNVAVPVSAWTQETDVLAGYSYKAQIVLADSSTECFPIVVFESEQAFSGNFASIAFAIAGYVEIFAKTIPTKDINVSAVTVIINGGVGKGITNAGADLADGSVSYSKLASDAVKLQFLNVSVPVASFVSDTTYQDYPYRASIALSNVLSSMIPEVVLSLTDVLSGDFAPVAESYDGGIYLYSASVPSNVVVIPTIICWR